MTTPHPDSPDPSQPPRPRQITCPACGFHVSGQPVRDDRLTCPECGGTIPLAFATSHATDRASQAFAGRARGVMVLVVGGLVVAIAWVAAGWRAGLIMTACVVLAWVVLAWARRAAMGNWRAGGDAPEPPSAP